MSNHVQQVRRSFGFELSVDTFAHLKTDLDPDDIIPIEEDIEAGLKSANDYFFNTPGCKMRQEFFEWVIELCEEHIGDAAYERVRKTNDNNPD